MNAHLLMLKGVIADLPAEDQEKVKTAADGIRAIVKATEPQGHGVLALALVASEMEEA